MASDHFDSNIHGILQNDYSNSGSLDRPHLPLHCPSTSENCSKPRKRYRPNHNEIERKRRMIQMQSIHALKNSIPSLQANKSSIIVIVSKAKEYIEYLSHRVQVLESLVLSYDKNALASLDSISNITPITHSSREDLENKIPYGERCLSQVAHDPILYQTLSLPSTSSHENNVSHDQPILSPNSDLSAHINLPPVDSYRQDIKLRPPSLKFPLRDPITNLSFSSRVPPPSSSFPDISPTMTSSENFICMNVVKSSPVSHPGRKISHCEKSTFLFTPESPVPINYPLSFTHATTCNHNAPQAASCIMQLPNSVPPQPSPTTHHATHFPAHFVKSPTAPMCSPLSPFSANVFSPTQPSHLSSEISTATPETLDPLKENFVQFFPSPFSASFQQLNLTHHHYPGMSNPPQNHHSSAHPPPLGSDQLPLLESPLPRYGDHEKALKGFPELPTDMNSTLNHVNLRYYTSRDP